MIQRVGLSGAKAARRCATALLGTGVIAFAACGDSTAPPPVEDKTSLIVDSSGGMAVTPSGNAGVVVQPGAFDREVEIIIERLPRPSTPGDGPLPTALDQFPDFYDFQVPVQPRFPITVAVCVVDPPDPLAPDAATASRLRLARPATGGGVEILPLADAGFLNCSSVPTSVSPSGARSAPGGLGGLASNFSPIGAVDAGPNFNDAPRLLSFDAPETVGNSPGVTGIFEFSYRDADGDITLAHITEIADPNGVWTGSATLDPGLSGSVEGMSSFQSTCTAAPSQFCSSGGSVTLSFQLEDSAGNLSNAIEATFTVVDESGGAPAVVPRRNPTRGSLAGVTGQ